MAARLEAATFQNKRKPFDPSGLKPAPFRFTRP